MQTVSNHPTSLGPASLGPTSFWSHYVVVALAILFVCFDHVRREFKQGMNVEGTIEFAHAELILFGLCLLGLLVVSMM